jgi:hypothetical protein
MSLNVNHLAYRGGRDAGIRGDQKMKVDPTKLLKTNIEKMSTSGFAMMFMKTKDLNLFCHDVYENIGA